MRPFRIGKHKVNQAEFDIEVLRLFKQGLKINQISKRLRRDRTTVWRALNRVEKPELETAKKERAFYVQTQDEFLNEPIVKDWVADMQTRRISSWRTIAAAVRKACEELQIFPDQFDLDWGKKWLALKKDVPLEQLRPWKTSLRSWFHAQSYTDYELTSAGFDAKHYAVGKWKHIKLTAGQITKVEQYLKAKASPETLFVFRFGMETCRPLEPIWSLRGDQFYTIDFKLPDGRPKTLYAVNIFRQKTEKAGAPFATAYVSQATFTSAKALAQKNGGSVMNGIKPESIYEELRPAYRAAGVEFEYSYARPIHTLRHFGAQYWLAETGFNRAVVAKIGGWLAEKTLEDHYGGVPEDVVRGFVGTVL